MVSLFNVLIKKYTSFKSNNIQRLFIQCDISQDNEWIGGICDDGSVSIYSKDMKRPIDIHTSIPNRKNEIVINMKWTLKH